MFLELSFKQTMGRTEMMGRWVPRPSYIAGATDIDMLTNLFCIDPRLLVLYC